MKFDNEVCINHVPKMQFSLLEHIRTAAFSAKSNNNYHKCATLYKLAAQQNNNPNSASDLYNSAICFNNQGNVKQALDILTESIHMGFHDVKQLKNDFPNIINNAQYPQLLTKTESNKKLYLKQVNNTLLALYESDQDDRQQSSVSKHPDQQTIAAWNKISERDQQRTKRVIAITKQDILSTADDYYHAAMVLQHSQSTEGYYLAHQLCLNALKINPHHDKARYLAAASLDRYLIGQHCPQLFGTQYVIEDGHFYQQPSQSMSKDLKLYWRVPSEKNYREQINKLLKTK
ncbi:hypothetical protein [Zooshikella sp. RANM57]|uniref:hypothetical protein n=1 Tax=Zooshikella sp. RANM57 TaxID=3425863 RepID=UPI003D6FDD01